MAGKTLVLSSWYLPHKIIGWQQAVTLVCLDKVEVLVSYSEEIRSPSTAIQLPAVVRLQRQTPAVKRRIRFSRNNVYARDGFCCCYCGRRFPVSQLTYDHVIPRAQGGRTVWDNIVTACRRCNAVKGNRTPEQAGMALTRVPVRPSSLPLSPPPIDLSTAPSEWRQFCVA